MCVCVCVCVCVCGWVWLCIIAVLNVVVSNFAIILLRKKELVVYINCIFTVVWLLFLTVQVGVWSVIAAFPC